MVIAVGECEGRVGGETVAVEEGQSPHCGSAT